MLIFELVIGLLFLGALLALWANRAGVPYPALLALVGSMLALLPGAPHLELDPELALALFVAPALVDAAYDASPRDLRRNLVPLLSLAVAMVVLTVMVVAWAVRLFVPELGWAAAIALGAIVAPPDASAASAVLRRLKPPHRLLMILEGESLFNDASALLVYRVAVAAAVTGSFSGWNVVPILLLTCGGGALAGWALARLHIALAARITDIPINVLLQFLGTFAVWQLAERAHLSAIITVVVFAMTLARRLGGRMNARQRIASYAVWEVAVLVLNVLAFILIGLQLRGILARVEAANWTTYALGASAACVAVIVVRIAWILTHTAIDVWWHRRSGRQASVPPTIGSGILASWCGMRGLVTLAAALALPDTLAHRDLVVFCAFCVVLTTLVLQGATLRPLMKRLCLPEDDTVEREAILARAETARAAMLMLDERRFTSPSASLLHTEYDARLKSAMAGPSQGASDHDHESLAALQRAAVDVQRRTLAGLRARQLIGDDALHVVEEELDLLELTADSRILTRADGSQ